MLVDRRERSAQFGEQRREAFGLVVGRDDDGDVRLVHGGGAVCPPWPGLASRGPDRAPTPGVSGVPPLSAWSFASQHSIMARRLYCEIIKIRLRYVGRKRTVMGPEAERDLGKAGPPRDAGGVAQLCESTVTRTSPFPLRS